MFLVGLKVDERSGQNGDFFLAFSAGRFFAHRYLGLEDSASAKLFPALRASDRPSPYRPFADTPNA